MPRSAARRPVASWCAGPEVPSSSISPRAATTRLFQPAAERSTAAMAAGLAL